MPSLPLPVRLTAVLFLLALAGFPFYWMFVTSLTPSSELFASTPRFLPTWSEAGVYVDAFRKIPVATWGPALPSAWSGSASPSSSPLSTTG